MLPLPTFTLRPHGLAMLRSDWTTAIIPTSPLLTQLRLATEPTVKQQETESTTPCTPVSKKNTPFPLRPEGLPKL